MSLSRLWQHQGKRQEAYDLLAPIYAIPLNLRPEHPGKFQQRRVGPGGANQR
jgi:hypothetical protein